MVVRGRRYWQLAHRRATMKNKKKTKRKKLDGIVKRFIQIDATQDFQQTKILILKIRI